MTRQITVTEHLLLHEKRSPEATGRFTSLLNNLVLAGKIISREVSKAGLVDVLGSTGEVNVQGERVQKLDEYANSILIPPHGAHPGSCAPWPRRRTRT